MFLTISLVIVDTDHRLSKHPSKGRSRGRQHGVFHRLDCVELSGSDISHTLSFCFPNVIELVQRIVRFVMRTEPKASYRGSMQIHVPYTSYIYLYNFYFSLIFC